MNEKIFLYPCSNRKEMGVYWLRYFSNISLYHSHNPSSSCYSCRQCYCYRCCCHFLCRYCYGYQYRLCCFIKGSKTPGKKQIFLQNETFPRVRYATNIPVDDFFRIQIFQSQADIDGVKPEIPDVVV